MLKISGLKPVEQIVLAKCLGENSDQYKEVRDKVKPGSYSIDALVHLTGTLSIGEPTDVNMPIKLDVKFLLEVLLERIPEAELKTLLKKICRRQKSAKKADLSHTDEIAEFIKAELGTVPSTQRGATQFKEGEARNVRAAMDGLGKGLANVLNLNEERPAKAQA